MREANGVELPRQDLTAFTEPMVNWIDAINQFLASCRARPVV